MLLCWHTGVPLVCAVQDHRTSWFKLCDNLGFVSEFQAVFLDFSDPDLCELHPRPLVARQPQLSTAAIQCVNIPIGIMF